MDDYTQRFRTLDVEELDMDEDLNAMNKAGYALLVDFLFAAPRSHRYHKQLKEYGATNFVQNKMDNSDMFQGLLDDDLGTVAKQATGHDRDILYLVIKYNNLYAVSDIFSKRTVSYEWWEKVQYNKEERKQ